MLLLLLLLLFVFKTYLKIKKKMYNKEFFYNLTMYELIQKLWTYRDMLVNVEVSKYYFWIPVYQRFFEEILRERWYTFLSDTDFFTMY